MTLQTPDPKLLNLSLEILPKRESNSEPLALKAHTLLDHNQ